MTVAHKNSGILEITNKNNRENTAACPKVLFQQKCDSKQKTALIFLRGPIKILRTGVFRDGLQLVAQDIFTLNYNFH